MAVFLNRMKMFKKLKSKKAFWEFFFEVGNTVKNTVFSPDFLVWKFCGKVKFPQSFGRIVRNYAETVPFRIRKLAEITVFFVVKGYVVNLSPCLKLGRITPEV